MFSVSDAAQAALLATHGVDCVGQIYFEGEAVGAPVEIVGGSITADRTAARLARGTVQVGLDTAAGFGVPLNSSDINTPYGYEIAVTWRIQVAGGFEDVPLGVFPIQTSAAEMLAEEATLTVEDRSRIVSDARLKDVYQIAGGTNYFTAIEALIADGYPTLVADFPTTTRTTRTTVLDAQQDRMVEASRMCRSLGHFLYFDRQGRLTARPEPSLSDDPVLTIASGVQVVDGGVTLDRTQVYNTVVAIGVSAELDGDAPRGEASITTGPLAVDSGFNERVRFYWSEYITDDAQAVEAATAILNAQTGLVQQLTLSIAANHTIDPYDVVAIEVPELELSGGFVIDAVTYPLGLNRDMTITTRSGGL